MTRSDYFVVEDWIDEKKRDIRIEREQFDSTGPLTTEDRLRIEVLTELEVLINDLQKLIRPDLE